MTNHITAYQDHEAAEHIAQIISTEDAPLIVVRCTDVAQAENINRELGKVVVAEFWKLRTRTYLEHTRGGRVMLQSGNDPKQAVGLNPTTVIDARYD